MLKRIRIALLMLLMMTTSVAHAALELVITEGINTARPIGIVPFKWEGSGELPQDLAGIVSADLRSSGKFSPLEESQMPQKPTDTSEVDAALWTQKGVDAVVTGTITSTGSGQYQIKYQLTNVAQAALGNATDASVDESGQLEVTPSTILLNKSAQVTTKQLRAYAHRISDTVYETLTGNRGAFSTRIAYIVQAGNTSYPYSLRIADYDGYNEQTLIRSKQPLMSPAWSPDASKIAYVSFENGRAEIFMVNVQNGTTRRLTSYPRHNGAPEFSPDGRKLAIVLSKSGSLQVYTLDLQTNQLTQVTHGSANNTEPYWYPDGRSLVFTSDRGGSPQIYKVNLSNQSTTRLTWQGSQNLGGQITPDGRSLIMVNRNSRGFNLAKQDLDTGAVQVLTTTQLDESPSLAPNGDMVIYSSIYQGKNVLSMVSVDGRFKARLPATSGRVRAPAWSPFLK
ncbi:MAG: Tol-Pal system beta propeller repeat protein TolB [Vibrio sp.]